MGVTRDGTVVRLVGACGVEEAETLCALCRDASVTAFDLSAAGPLHTALVQALIALAPPCRGTPVDAFMADFVLHALEQAREARRLPDDV